jgi:hypothetical protein
MLLVTLATEAAGQTILRGEVVHNDSTSAAPGLLVEVRTPSARVFRTLTNQRGEFIVRLPGPDSVRVRVLRIGYRPTESAKVFVDEGPSPPLRIVLDNTSYHLSSVTIQATSRCGRRADPAAYLRWEQALTVLRSIELAERDTSLHVRTVEFQGPTTADGFTTLEEDSLLRVITTVDPLPAVHYDSLFQRGFVRKNPGDTAMTYYAPDAQLLADDRFAPGYCFRTPKDSVPGLIGITFEPVTRRRVTDIDGTVWLDAASLELRRIEFSYGQLPVNHNSGHWHSNGADNPAGKQQQRIPGAGGYVDFTRLPGGHWLVSEWTIRMATTIIWLGRCRADVHGNYVGPIVREVSCSRVIFERHGLWGRSRIVASVVREGEQLYFDSYAEELARRAEAALRKPR